MNILQHCQLCDNKITSLEKGLTCKLTNRKPEFKNTCSDIKWEKEFQEKLENVNLELEIIRNKKKSILWSFYSISIIGFLLIIGGNSITIWDIYSPNFWKVKIGIIGIGITFLGIAYKKLYGFRKKLKTAKSKKNKFDSVIKVYGISYKTNFEYQEKIHGNQIIEITTEYKNWTKKRTTTPHNVHNG